MEKYGKFLPIGTIVLLKKGKIPIMIIGYYVEDVNGEKKDYSAVSYPEGLLTLDAIVAFNHEDIKTIFESAKRTMLTEKYNEHLLENIKN